MAENLKRQLGLGLLITYGIGIMVGAGIYVLVGAAAGAAGVWAPLSFLLAAIVAAPTALSFAELSARVPEAGGAASFVELGLKRHWLSLLVGAVVVIAGTVSAAAVLRGGVGYLISFLPIPFIVAIIGLGLFLIIIAVIGVLESLIFVAFLTVIEVIGLLLVIWAGFGAEPVAAWQSPPAPVWSGVAAATIFAFFAFIGFEDMANMAEETRNPERNMPLAILISVALTMILYMLVTMAAVRAVPRELLAVSEKPLALVWEHGSGKSGSFLSAIAVAAALNGVLAQIIMASRVLYGLGKRSPRLSLFHHSHKRFGTPVLATILIGAVVILFALALPVAALAEITTLALLIVFAIVNLSLIGLKRRAATATFSVPVIVPWFGLFACLAAFAASIGAGL